MRLAIEAHNHHRKPISILLATISTIVLHTILWLRNRWLMHILDGLLVLLQAFEGVGHDLG